MTADPKATADYIAARASESLSYGDLAYAQSQGWCSSSPDGMGPHRPDDTTDPLSCAECGVEIEDAGDPDLAAFDRGVQIAQRLIERGEA